MRAPGDHKVAGQLTYIPRRAPKHPALLLAFHGLGDEPSEMEFLSGLDPVARRNGFVVAYLAAHGGGLRWQLNHDDGDQDIDNLRASLPKLVARTCADPNRVYLTGFSNGAGFAWRAGCELAGQVAAVGLVSGSYRSQDACPAGTRPMPTLEIHGSDPWTSTVARLVADTKARNHCRRAPVTTPIAAGVTRTRWPGCNLERIHNRNIGHVWLTRGPYNSSAEVWKFVSRFRR